MTVAYCTVAYVLAQALSGLYLPHPPLVRPIGKEPARSYLCSRGSVRWQWSQRSSKRSVQRQLTESTISYFLRCVMLFKRLLDPFLAFAASTALCILSLAAVASELGTITELLSVELFTLCTISPKFCILSGADTLDSRCMLACLLESGTVRLGGVSAALARMFFRALDVVDCRTGRRCLFSVTAVSLQSWLFAEYAMVSASGCVTPFLRLEVHTSILVSLSAEVNRALHQSKI